MATNETVYEGFWINWTDGQIRGSTLTLNRRSAAFLIAFLALYVTLAGTHFWQLLCWLTFQLRSSGQHAALQDDPVQTLLRNSESSAASAIDFGCAAWKWRIKSRSKTLQRAILPHDLYRTALWLHILAVITLACFLVAGVFSSRVTNTRSDVLLRPAICGYWTKLSNPGGDYGKEIVRVSKWEGQRSVNWADSSLLTQYCSRRNQNDPSTCMAPGREFARWNFTVQNSCPFNGTCISPSLMLDSGLVDSSEHLGINTPKIDRIAFRKQLTCSPVNVSDHTRKYDQLNVTQLWPASMSSNDSDSILNWLEPEIDNPSHAQIYNGSLFDAIFLGQSSFDADMEATFVQNEALWMNYNSGRTKGSGEAYAIQIQQHISGGPEALDSDKNRFTPINDVRRDNSSTLLMFLMNGYTYSGGPVDDPWFKTTSSSVTPHGGYSGAWFETWWADYDKIGTLACFEDDEICNIAHDTPRCAPVNPYGSSLQDSDLSDSLQLNSRQRAIAERFKDALGKSAFADMVVELNGASMLARKRSYDGSGCALPSDQWTLELQQWFSTSLTATEIAIKQFVTGFGEPYDQYVVSPSLEDKWMCHAQVTKSASYASFSVLGLGIILVFGGVIILTNLLAESTMRQLRTRTRWLAHSQHLSERWEQAELLNLHNRYYNINSATEKCDNPEASAHSSISYTSTAPLIKADKRQGSIEHGHEESDPSSQDAIRERKPTRTW